MGFVTLATDHAQEGHTMLRGILSDVLATLQKKKAIPHDADLSRIVLDVPPKGQTGDIATNAAFVLAKALRKPPRVIAGMLQEAFEAHPLVASALVAGAGFVNIFLNPGAFYAVLSNVLHQGALYGHGTWGQGQRVNVEYVSVNPTGPLHIGHGRVAIVGDVMANLLTVSGFDVVREYYVNDAGGQIETLARSVYLRYREAHGEDIGAIPAGCYPGLYLKDVAMALKVQEGRAWLEQDESAWLPFFEAFSVQLLMQSIKKTMRQIGIQHDVFRSEKDLTLEGRLEKTIDTLEHKGYVYKGTLQPPKGREKEWTPKELLLFKATAFGEPQDVPLTKADSGQFTYFAGDMAYHDDKIERGFDTMINVWGADHAGHVGRLKAAVTALGGSQKKLSFILCQMVHVLQKGEPLKMSKRAGGFVTLNEVVDVIGCDVLRFIMASRSHDTQLTLDLDEVLKTSKENPVFYVHYAYARACSIKRAAADIWDDTICQKEALLKADFTQLNRPSEYALMRKMAFWPACIEGATRTCEPHRITTFLHDFASLFHTLWGEGNQDTTLRFLSGKDKDLSLARLALVESVRCVIEEGLTILGVTTREQLVE